VPRRVPAWVWVVAVLLFALGGGAVALVNYSGRARVRKALRDAARRLGVDPDLPDAIGYVESRWRPATNLSGPDGARGGAWGPTQITERTARDHGFGGDMAELNASPELAAEWTSRILAARPGGPPRTIQDAAAWWNAGRPSASQLGAAHVTRTDYIPKAEAALALVRAEGEPEPDPGPEGAA
jgi:soluble lytic murein transglycosylase-like protein